MTNKRVAKNASWIIGAQIVKALLSLVISMFSARYLGPQNFGLISYAESLASFVTPIVYMGLRGVLVQEIVNNPEKEGETLGTAIILSFFSAVLCMVGLYCFVSISNKGETETIIVCVLYSVLLIFQSFELIQYWFQSKLLSKQASLIALGAYLIKSAYKIYILVSAKRIGWFAVSNSVDFMLISIGLFWCYKRLGGKMLSFSAVRSMQLLGKSKYYLFSDMMRGINSSTGRILLKSMISAVAIGYYSAASTLINMTNFVYQAILDSFRPVIFENKNKDELLYEESLCQLYSLMIYLTVVQNLILMGLASLVIKVVFGSDYSPAADVLKLLVWGTTFSYIGFARNIWLLAENLQHYVARINTIGAIISVALNIFLIPLMGILGAAMASLVSDFVINILLPSCIKQLRRSNVLLFKAMNPAYILKMASGLLSKS